MKKSWSLCFLAVLLLGGNLAFGNELTPRSKAKAEIGTSEVVPTESESTDTGLTPRRKTDKSVVLAQQSTSSAAVPAPPKAAPASPYLVAQATPPTPALEVPAPAPAYDAHILAELDRLSADVAKLKKDTKKPDTKKGWSTPKVAGRIFIDSTNVMDQDADSKALNGDMQNGTGFREVRLGVTGNGFDSFDYKIEFGFTGSDGRVDLIDNWIGVKNLPLLGYVRAGHFKPETGLYYPMSTNDVSLMEYGVAPSAFGLGRRIGVASENTFADDHVRFFMGVFQEGTTNRTRNLQEDNQGQVVNMRLSAAPVFAEGGKRVIHVGGHWAYVSLEGKKNGLTSISATPGSFGLLDSSTLTTGSFACDHYNRGGLEFAAQNGPLSIRSEFFAGSYDAYRDSPTRNVFGAYVEAGWFLTGEYRSYDLKKGGFGGPKVNRNFHPFKCGDSNLIDGFGAWQVIAQWNYLDLSDWRYSAGAKGKAGYQNDIALGLSWFWTPNIRWVFEYVHSVQDIGINHVSATEDIFGTSLRMHF